MRLKQAVTRAGISYGRSSAFVAVLALMSGIQPLHASSSHSLKDGMGAFAQAAPAPADTQQKPIYSMSDLEYLLGPIALYPDSLLAILLPATAFPLQIVQADRWIANHPKTMAANDFSQVDAMSWDPSVQALARFPDVIKMLADHLDWTQSLGMAFSLQSEEVGTVIQLLRAKAENLGNLKSTPEQVVTVREEGPARVIYIAPANPERIYVPVYDSTTVFYSAVPSALAFSTGVIVGSVWNNRWGWNDRRWNQVWIHPPVWHAPPPNWRPPGRPGARPPAVWRPDRPGNRPDRPGVRPDRPGTRPDRPGVRPDRPGMRPDRPGDRPGVRPDRPAVRPDRPAVRPDRPVARPDRPNVRPDRPGVRPDRPSARPDRPAARPDRPAQRPGGGANRPNIQRPQAAPQRPQARPQARPQQSRPQQRARPQQGARPQQRARPQGGGGGGGGQRNRPQRSRSD